MLGVLVNVCELPKKIHNVVLKFNMLPTVMFLQVIAWDANLLLVT